MNFSRMMRSEVSIAVAGALAIYSGAVATIFTLLAIALAGDGWLPTSHPIPLLALVHSFVFVYMTVRILTAPDES